MGERSSPDNYVVRAYEHNNLHYYLKEDGNEVERKTYTDLSFLQYMPNLSYLNIVCADIEALPDLSGMTLQAVRISNSRIPDFNWLAGVSVYNLMMEDVQDGLDFSPLTACEKLTRIDINFGDTKDTDLNNAAPPALNNLSLNEGQYLNTQNLAAFAACGKLARVRLDNIPITNLNFLEGKKITTLEVYHINTLGDISAIGTLEKLEELYIGWCRQIYDFSVLAENTKLRQFSYNEGGNPIRNASFLEGKPELQSVDLYGVRLQNLDFLKQLRQDTSIHLAVHGYVKDWSALAAVSEYEWLNIASDDNSFEPIRPFLEEPKIDYLMLNRFKGLDLAVLPSNLRGLEIWECDLTDLSGLPEMKKLQQLTLYDLPELTSLNGIEVLKESQLEDLSVFGCPRLTDWSAAEGLKTGKLELVGTYTMPELEKIRFSSLNLDSLIWLEDLSCLDGLPEDRYYNLDLLGLDLVTDLSPVRRLKGHNLRVSPILKEQAESLVEEGRFSSCEVEYPNAGWNTWKGNVQLRNLDELDTLPRAALKRIENLQIAGDQLIDWETYDLWEQWDDNGRYYAIHNKETDELTRVMAGTMTDMSRLSQLTGLVRLEIVEQPLTTLDGIGDMMDLEEITLKDCKQLEDISQLFTLEKIRIINLGDVPVSSIQGIQNLPMLEELYLHDTHITDISPLADCDLTEASRQDGLTLDIKNNEEYPVDPTPLESIRKFNYVPLNEGDVYDWLPHMQNAEVNQLCIDNIRRGDTTDLTILGSVKAKMLRIDSFDYLTSLNGLEGMIASGSLETLEILGCPRISDWSALESGYIPKLWLYSTFTIPDLSNMNIGTLRLEQLNWLKDLNALETLGQEREINLELVDLANLKDLNALKSIRGNRLAVTEDLLNQARTIVNSGAFQSSEIADGDGWGVSNDRFSLTSLEELDTLPDSVLAMVTEVHLAGDQLYDSERYWTEWNFENNQIGMDLKDRETGNRVPISYGTRTDLTFLSKLTGLRQLEICVQGLTSLAGIENMPELEEIWIKAAPNLTDVSALWNLKNLRRIELNQTGADSIDGIQNLPMLQSFQMYGVDLRDISALRECNFEYAYQNGGLEWFHINLEQDADASPLEAIRQFSSLELSDEQVQQWLPHLRNATVENLTLRDCHELTSLDDLPQVTGFLGLHNMSGLKDLTGLKAPGPKNGIQLDNLPNLESLNGMQEVLRDGIELLDIGGCPRLADWSALDEAKPGKLRIYGDLVFLPEHLKEIAEPVNQEIDPGEWWSDSVSIGVNSLDELDTLPDALLRGIEEIWLAGDRIYDRSQYDIWDHWEGDRQFFDLHEFSSNQTTPIETGTMTDLSRLSRLTGLKALHMHCQPLTSLAGIENLTDLEQLEIVDAHDLTSISEAYGLENLSRIMFQNTGISDIDGIQNLKKLTELRAYANIRDCSPLAQCDLSYAYEQGGLGLYMNVEEDTDLTPLESIRKFSWLQLDWGKAERWLPHLQNAVIHTLQINDDPIADLSLIPGVTDMLEFHSVQNITDLTGLKGPGPHTIQLDDLPAMTSLNGIHDLIGEGGIREIELGGCPRLADWSALEGTDLEKIEVYGDLVFVPDSLQDKVQQTNGDGGWWKDGVGFNISGLEDLMSLPEAARAKIDALVIAGDEVYDANRFRLEQRGSKVVLINQDSGEEQTLRMGKGIDLAFLNDLPGLDNLTIGMEPITDIEALRSLTGLKILKLSYCAKLKDISAITDMPDLEELQLDGTGVTSLDSIRGHNKLRCLSLNNLKITDLSPLAECDYAWAEACGGMSLSIDNTAIKDWSFLSRVPKIEWMGMGGINPDYWMDAVSSSQIRGIYCSSFNQDQLVRFLEQHPEIEELHIQDCRQIRDLSMLAGMPNLRFAFLSDKQMKMIEGTDYRFEVNH